MVVATATHPFWVPALRGWVEAQKLQPGMWLQTSSGTYVQISAITKRTVADQRVHNLTVADLHTYYVLAGNSPLLVHNTGPCGDLGPRWKAADPSKIPCSTGCEKVAEKIKAKIGGEIKTIEVDPQRKFQLGPYRKHDSGWYSHTVVVKDGRVYDGFSPRTGVPVDEYKKLFDYHDVINFGF